MKKLFIAGHRGMVGTALIREAEKLGGFQIVTATRDQLDLCDQSAVFHHRGGQGRWDLREFDLPG